MVDSRCRGKFWYQQSISKNLLTAAPETWLREISARPMRLPVSAVSRTPNSECSRRVGHFCFRYATRQILFAPSSVISIEPSFKTNNPTGRPHTS